MKDNIGPQVASILRGFEAAAALCSLVARNYGETAMAV
jgi:hypothetical protein